MKITVQDADTLLAHIQNAKMDREYTGDASIAAYLLRQGYRKVDVDTETKTHTVTIHSEQNSTIDVQGRPKIINGDEYGRGNDLHIYDGAGDLVCVVNSIAFERITITAKEQGNG